VVKKKGDAGAVTGAPGAKSRVPAAAGPKTAKNAAARPKARASSGAAAREDHEARGEDHEEPTEREDDDEERDADGEPAEREADEEVVEVVGEIVDETSMDGDDAAVMRAGRSTAPPPSTDAALSRTDPLQAYLREVQRHPLLTPEEEKTLTVYYQKNQDVPTAARLVTANLRLVVKLAYEYRRAYKNIMDLIQEGNIGLMQAVKRYDPYRGVKLSSYAAWWIRAYILRFILNNWRLVKLGTTQAQRKLFFNLNKEKAKLAAMGIEPSAAEIAKRLSVDEKDVVDMDRRLSSGEASLDAPVGDSDGRSVSRIEMLPSMTSGPDAAYEQSEMGELVHERLRRFSETLKGKDIVIFQKRMVAEDPLTLQELGDEFGISRERVRQLEARLTQKLRTYLQEELGDAVHSP
jgi:RNA polymerase sigma-32 factor